MASIGSFVDDYYIKAWRNPRQIATTHSKGRAFPHKDIEKEPHMTMKNAGSNIVRIRNGLSRTHALIFVTFYALLLILHENRFFDTLLQSLSFSKYEVHDHDGSITTSSTDRRPFEAEDVPQVEIGSVRGSQSGATLTLPSVSEVDSKGNLKTSQPTSYHFDFPSEPLYNAQSIVEDAIGKQILSDPSRNPLRNCSPTVQYRLTIRESTGVPQSSNTWTLQSMMRIPKQKEIGGNGVFSNPTVVPKPYGGDEIYVLWETDSPNSPYDMGVANVTDMHDGTYTLKFTRPPMLQHNQTGKEKVKENDDVMWQQHEFGRLTIHYEYTCSIGSIFAPNKDHYTRAGEVLQTLNTTSSMSIPRPYIHDFIPPNIDQAIDLSQYDTIIAFGDSLIMQLVREYLRNKLFSDNIIWDKNVYQCLSNQNDVQNMLYKFHTRHGEQISNLSKSNQRIALITGSSSWDAMRGCVHEDLQDHLNAIRTYVNNVTLSFPDVDIYWKSPSSLFIHRYTTYLNTYNETFFKSLKPRYGVKPLKPRYINYHIPQQLYNAQKDLMRDELHLPFLDLFESYFLSAPWTVPGDGRHFLDDLSQLQLSYFWPGLLSKRISA